MILCQILCDANFHVSDSVLDCLYDVSPARGARAVAVEVRPAAALAVAHEHAGHVAHSAAADVAPAFIEKKCTE